MATGSTLSPSTVQLSPEVAEFCDRQGITRYLPQLLEIVDECFPGRGAVRFSPDMNPETDEPWLNIEFDRAGSSGELVTQYKEYTHRKTHVIPWQDEYKFHVVCNLAGR